MATLRSRGLRPLRPALEFRPFADALGFPLSKTLSETLSKGFSIDKVWDEVFDKGVIAKCPTPRAALRTRRLRVAMRFEKHMCVLPGRLTCPTRREFESRSINERGIRKSSRATNIRQALSSIDANRCQSRANRRNPHLQELQERMKATWGTVMKLRPHVSACPECSAGRRGIGARRQESHATCQGIRAARVSSFATRPGTRATRREFAAASQEIRTARGNATNTPGNSRRTPGIPRRTPGKWRHNVSSRPTRRASRATHQGTRPTRQEFAAARQEFAAARQENGSAA
jgi:hypothetical protein